MEILENLLSVEQVAEILQITERVIRRYAREGKIKGIKIGTIWRFEKRAIQEMIEKGRQ